MADDHIMYLPKDIIKNVILARVSTFAEIRLWSCTCTWIRDCVDMYASIDDTLNDTQNITINDITDKPKQHTEDYRVWKSRLGNLRLSRLRTNCAEVVAMVLRVGHLYIDMSHQTSDISHIIADIVTLNFTDIDTTMIPQVRHLNLFSHCNYARLGHLTRLESLHILSSDVSFASLASLTSLTSLTVEDHEDYEGALPCMMSLITLRAPHYNVTDLAVMTNLTDLDARVTDHELLGLSSLTVLTIREPDIIYMTTLQKLPLLKLSDISVNNVYRGAIVDTPK